MSNDAPESLAAELSRLHSQTGELHDLLQRERDALIARDIDTLSEVIERKEAVCGMLASTQDRTPSIADRVADVSPDSHLARLHGELVELAERCKHLNQVNGKITHRSQQSRT